MRPRRVWIGTAAVLLVMALGNLAYNDWLTTGNGFRDDVESVEGQELIDASFPGGANAPTEVVVPDPHARRRAWPRPSSAPTAWPTCASRCAGRDGVLLNAILEGDPYDKDTFALVPADPRRRARGRRRGHARGRRDRGGVRRAPGQQARRQADRAAHAARGA